MLQTLQNELNTLQINIKKQDIILENLYISFQEIYDLSNNLNNPITTKHNMFKKLRPEVSHQILIFLDIKQILQFRLVNWQANAVVKLMLPKQIIIIKEQIADLQNQIQLKIQSEEEIAKDQNLQQSLNLALDGLFQINKAHINELKSFSRPPELVEKIINLVCMTLDPTFKIQKGNWKECQKFLNRQNFMEQIQSLDISYISDKQLEQLEEVNNIYVEQASSISKCASSLLIFLYAVFQLRQCKLYVIQNKIKQLESKVQKEEQFIQKLGKIIK